MHQSVRKAIETYLKEGRVPALEEIGLSETEYARSKEPVFVTFYKDGKVVGSSGRIHATGANTAKEAIEHALLCLNDPRFVGTVTNPSDFANVRIRIDILPASKRRMLQKVDELDLRKEGLLFLAQGRNALSVVLPGMAPLVETPRQMLAIALKKAGIEPSSIKEEEYIVYGIETVVSSDF